MSSFSNIQIKGQDLPQAVQKLAVDFISQPTKGKLMCLSPIKNAHAELGPGVVVVLDAITPLMRQVLQGAYNVSPDSFLGDAGSLFSYSNSRCHSPLRPISKPKICTKPSENS